jgi:uncharacterized protein involved in exopolysaccharide biosynthesis
MPRIRHKPQEIVAKLHQVDVLMSSVPTVADAISAIGVSKATYYRWRQDHGGPKSERAKRLKNYVASGPLDGRRLEAVRVLQQGDEDHIFTILALLWRRSWIIAGFCLVVVIIAALATSLVQPRYTADAIIQVNPASDKRQAQSGIAQVGIALNAETEARLISSRTIAQRVVARLGLTNDTALVLRKPLLTARLHDLFASVWPSSGKLPSRSAESLIADELMRNLKVTNDVRSYLIKISYTSTSPERSARIATAFAEEYIRARSTFSSRQALADLVAAYGPKHPRVLRAQAELDEANRRPNISEDVQLLMPAEPIAVPSSPKWRLILGLAFVGSLAVGSIVVLIQEHAAFRR